MFKPEKLQVNLINTNNIEILADDLLLIKLGDEKFLEEKHQMLQVLLSYIQHKWEQVAYVDVKSMKNPAIKYKEK